MAGIPPRGPSFDRNDELSLQPGHHPSQPPVQPYYQQQDISPIEGSNPQFPPPAQNMSPPSLPVHRNLPFGMHPDSAFAQLQSQRQYGVQPAVSSQNHPSYSQQGVTPGADNLGETAAGGGINGIALGVANMNERESGAQALRDIDNWGRNGEGNIAGPRATPPERNEMETPFADHYVYESPAPTPPRPMHSQPSYGSGSGSNGSLAAGALAPAAMMSGSNSERSLPLDNRPSPHLNAYPYQDSPYNRYSSSNLNLGEINPNDVAENEDDWGTGPQPQPQPKRRSFIPFGSSSHDVSREGTPGSAAAVAAGAAGAAGVVGATASRGSRDSSGNYNAVPGGQPEPAVTSEKSAWLASQTKGRKKLTWIVGSILALVVIGAIVGGVLGAVLRKNGSGKDGQGAGGGQNSPAAVANDNKNDLSISSSEIQALMNNKALHKVFPGMDYTPLNTQYPDCLTLPASQNNITRDMAVLSQLTNAVRLYGTDCNQTEMVLHAIDRLKLTDMKVWLGVWLGNNGTTNDRQVAQMYKILDDAKTNNQDGLFKGVIVGNEVLFRKDLTEAQLIANITEIKNNLTSKGYKIPVATSDLGSSWTAGMADQVDIVMSNVHPFFGGVPVDQAAGWTWDFWQNNDVVLTKGKDKKQIISEVGWPSGGGNDCSPYDCTTATAGAVSGIDEMNKFMDDWICQSLTNGTEYFWFEAFDEPWKIIYNTPGKEWEDKWGLLDVNRKLKPGLTIPDCGGNTAS